MAEVATDAHPISVLELTKKTKCVVGSSSHIHDMLKSDGLKVAPPSTVNTVPRDLPCPGSVRSIIPEATPFFFRKKKCDSLLN